MNMQLGLVYKAENEVWFIQFLSEAVNSMRFNILNMSQISYANGYAEAP